MSVKAEFQEELKEQFGINKNISESLSREECERILNLLSHEQSMTKLVEAYAEKNSTLGSNNAAYARARNQAQRNLEALKEEHAQLEHSIGLITESNAELEKKKEALEQDRIRLESQIQNLSVTNQSLSVEVQKLNVNNQQLTKANITLAKDNSDLKNTLDQIKLRLAIDIKELLEYENSELRKAAIRLFGWILG